MLEILAQFLFWYAIWWDLLLYESDINLLLSLHLSIECINMKVIYSHQSGGIANEHWLTDFLLYLYSYVQAQTRCVKDI
jgi:hypothetical protein